MQLQTYKILEIEN